ncbi:hypothetical protein Q8A67_014123 [Cirrhinus molitorella]|uniref:Uncharacterized protein n=1 Tax=Cirrhinus molitorella TaxID=172907 RepID=A0AA88TU14_9TELE|nr:hypothetical protein Q8A67_014123 [Cirrhinus molitorella]
MTSLMCQDDPERVSQRTNCPILLRSSAFKRVQKNTDSSDRDIPPEHSNPQDKSIHEVQFFSSSADLWECVPAEAPLGSGFRNDLQTRFLQIHQTRSESPSPFICCS